MKQSEIGLIFIPMFAVVVISYLEILGKADGGGVGMLSPEYVMGLSLTVIFACFILALLAADRKPLEFKLSIEKRRIGKDILIRPVFKFKNNLEDEAIYINQIHFGTIDKEGYVIETKNNYFIGYTNGMAVEPGAGWLIKYHFDFKSITEHGICCKGNYIFRGQIRYTQDDKEKTKHINKKWIQTKSLDEV